MAPRSSWKGFLNLSLVSVPVRAYSATDSSGTIRLNQLHAECNSRVQYKTACPICGDIPRSEIVKGYEYAKDQYVVIDLEELEKLRAQDEGKAIRIDKFISPDQLDPIYFNDTSYYLVPDGAAGQKPYALLMKAMQDKSLYCVARIVSAQQRPTGRCPTRGWHHVHDQSQVHEPNQASGSVYRRHCGCGSFQGGISTGRNTDR